MHRSIVVLGLVLAAACADLNETPAFTPQVISSGETVLAVGDTVLVDGLVRIVFVDVPSDSRCPSQVVCIWAGDAAVVLQSAYSGGWPFADTLHTTLEPRTAEKAGYRITLLDLSPYPAQPEPIPPDAYALRVRIERLTFPPD